MKPNSISKNKNNRGSQQKWITRTAFIFAAFGLLTSVRSAEITPVQLPPDVFAVTAMTESPAPFENEFCWRDSYGRSAGEMPGRVADCPPGYTNNGATCGRGPDTILAPSEVASCPAGYTNMGLTCYRGPHSYGNKCKGGCPKGYKNTGCTCLRPASTLSASHMVCPQGFHQSNITKLCIVDCPAGYTNTGLTCFKPASTLGMGSMSCHADEVKFGARCYPTGICGAGQELNGAICYPKCKAGYDGVGPVCWSDPPPGWVRCGMGAAKDEKTCASIVFDQVYSVGKLAFASYGAMSKILANYKKAKDGPKKASLLRDIKEKYKELKNKWNRLKEKNPKLQEAEDARAIFKKLKRVDDATETAEDAVTPEDMIRAVAEMISILDPTGISSVVASYTYPKCSQYSPPRPDTASSCAEFVPEFETACRGANDGGNPKDPEAQKDSNKYFDLYKYDNEKIKRTPAACQAACKAGCTGVEYNDSNGRCELWKVPITGTVPQPGYTCYTRR